MEKAAERGATAIVVDGKAYTLDLTTNAMCELEDLMSTPAKPVTFMDVLERVHRNSVQAIRALVWASLREHHSEMTVEDAGRLIHNAGGIVGFGQQIAALTTSTSADQADLSTVGSSQEAQKTTRRRSGSTGRRLRAQPSGSGA